MALNTLNSSALILKYVSNISKSSDTYEEEIVIHTFEKLWQMSDLKNSSGIFPTEAGKGLIKIQVTTRLRK